MRSSTVLMVASVVFVGCVSTVNTDSTHYLRSDQSTVYVQTPVDTTVLDVVRTFRMRGVVLAERQAATPPGSVVLTLAASRGHLGHDAIAYDIGSVYYVRVEPAGSGAKVMLVGKPMVDGVAPCTAATSEAGCSSDIGIDSGFADEVTGRDEAAMIHGVLTELALNARTAKASDTAANDRAITADQFELRVAAQQHADCVAQRREIASRGTALTNLDERAKVLQTMPSCPVAHTPL